MPLLVFDLPPGTAREAVLKAIAVDALEVTIDADRVTVSVPDALTAYRLGIYTIEAYRGHDLSPYAAGRARPPGVRSVYLRSEAQS